MRGKAETSAALLVAVLLVAPRAAAYCRTTTCDFTDPLAECVPDEQPGCVTKGKPLYWPERCISFGVQQDGSPSRGIPYEEADRIIQQAFQQWISVDCGGGARPSLKVWDIAAPYGGIICNEPEFNENEPNANVWMFRDADWPYQGQGTTLALTTITYEVPTGEILDADVEVNSHGNFLTTGDTNVQNDLLSIATHEAGHFLGLAHTMISTATMHADYRPGDLAFRSLEPDDEAGICAAYPPDRDAPDCKGPRPRHGFTRYCADPVERSGCVQAGSSGAPAYSSAGGLLIAAALCAARWRRRGAARARR